MNLEEIYGKKKLREILNLKPDYLIKFYQNMEEIKPSSLNEIKVMIVPPTPLIFLMEILRVIWYDYL